jgi:hypothetical protein
VVRKVEECQPDNDKENPAKAASGFGCQTNIVAASPNRPDRQRQKWDRDKKQPVK